MREHHVEFYAEDLFKKSWFCGKRWNPYERKSLTGHPLIDPELLGLYYRFKRFVFNKLCQIGWLEDDFKQEMRITRTRLNLDKIFDSLSQCQYSMMMIQQKRAKYIIVGRDQFPKVMQQAIENQRIHAFEVPASYRSRIYEGGFPRPYFFQGLKIVLVPWVDGLFLLPDLEER